LAFVVGLACPRCGREYSHREPRNVCDCGSPLLVAYDLEAVRSTLRKEDLGERTPSMWRYQELLPVEDPDTIVSLGEGLTPLLSVAALGHLIGLPSLWWKEEGGNPTGTFKARGASCGVSRALELGVQEVALPSAGNAGGAWACYGAAAGLEVHVALPSDAPEIHRLECAAYGADVILVDGLISDAAATIEERVLRDGWFDVATLREPYRVEGKKTLGFEIAEQLGWRVPDAIVCPTGGGVGVIGIWLALNQLAELGWVEGKTRLLAVQAEGCAPIVRAYLEGGDEAETWEGAETIAQGLRIPKPLGDFLVLRALGETDGIAVAVPDEEILEAMSLLAREAGVLAGPEAAAGLAGAKILRERGELRAEDRVVLLGTGTGLKDPEALSRALEGSNRQTYRSHS
jgi:threonine synthase